MSQRKMIYNLSEDKKELYLIYFKYEEKSVESFKKDYDLKEFDYMSLYNTILDDLNAEFDDNVADIIEKMVDDIYKGVD